MNATTRTGRTLAFVLGLSVFAASCFARELARARPVEIGLSSARLSTISELIAGKVDRAEFPGPCC